MGYLKKSLGLFVLLAAVLLLVPSGVWARPIAQNPPPFPAVFSGSVMVGGKLPPIGSTIYAEVAKYRSNTANIGENGRFVGLSVGPPEAEGYVGQNIYFYYQGIRADQTTAFRGVPASGGVQEITLTFPALPVVGDENVARAFGAAAALGLMGLLGGGTLFLRARDERS